MRVNKYYMMIEGVDSDYRVVPEDIFNAILRLKEKGMARNVKLKTVNHG